MPALLRLPRPGLCAALCLALATACGGEAGGARSATAPTSRPAGPVDGYEGRAVCAECHAREERAWIGSHHDLAMQEAGEDTVLGDFDDAELVHFGVTSTFTRRGGDFVVRTEGPDGALADFVVAYTFGVYPLQQYLVAFPDGRLQTLHTCWDSRPAEQGGQRWFHLYPDEAVPAEDALHWSRRPFTWNFACAECHSTGVRRGYDAERDRYATTWEEIDVSCEACHGPGREHVAWARAVAAGERPESVEDLGLVVQLRDRSGAGRVLDPERGVVQRSAPPEPDLQLDTCGRCHSRRRQLREGYGPGEPLLATHVPELLEDGLYHADGQILDEVYVWGSFVQSRMHAAGVRCTDCHDPHSLQLRAPGNQLCNLCHVPTRYDTPEHHFHPDASQPGTACVDCHMPATLYMVVDARNDHAFSIPRPALTVELGTPNACNACHDDKDAAWALETVERWYPQSARTHEPHFARALAAARANDPAAAPALEALVADVEQPALVRATAAAELARFPSESALGALAAAASDPQALVRREAVGALEALPGQLRVQLAASALADAVPAVRMEAARVLADVPPEALPAELREAAAAALSELVASERLNADTPEARHNLGLLAQRRGRAQEAEVEYRAALRLDPAFAPAAINLADLLRELERDREGESVLREGLRASPQSAALHHALGLALVRLGRADEALESLARAARLAPDDARIGYVHGVALLSLERREAARLELERVLATHPRDPDVLVALVGLAQQEGDRERALALARRLAEAWPDDPGARRLLEELERARR